MGSDLLVQKIENRKSRKCILLCARRKMVFKVLCSKNMEDESMLKELELDEIMVVEGGHYGYAERFENVKPFPDSVNRVIAFCGHYGSRKVREFFEDIKDSWDATGKK